MARAVRPAGTYRLKARRLRAFTRWLLERFDGRFQTMRRAPLAALRRDLLGVHGVGPETADAILLYAAGRPVFVADEYARRVLARHRLIAPRARYEAMRAFVEAHLPSDPALFSAYHALLVAVGQEHCGTIPRCDGCPLALDDLDAAGRPGGALAIEQLRRPTLVARTRSARRRAASGTARARARSPISLRRRGSASRSRTALTSEAGVSADCGRTTAPPARATMRAFAVCSSPLVPGRGT